MSLNATAARRLGAAPALLGLLLLGACGTRHIQVDNLALDGQPKPAAWNGTIAIASDPAGARCTVTRNGAEVARVAATPGNVQLARGNSPAQVACSAPGRMDTTVTLRPLRDFGLHHHQPTGPVGAMNHREDIASGRVRRFDDVTVAMPPASFASAAERDAWFAQRAQAVRAGWATPIARATRSQDAMIDTSATLRGYEAEDLAALDRQRAAAVIAPAARRR